MNKETKNVLSTLADTIKNLVSSVDETEKEDNIIKVSATKCVEVGDKRLFTSVVLRPNVMDAHKDIYDDETVSQACHDYTAYCMNQNLQHVFDVEKADVSVVESYIAPCDMELDNGSVLQGDWVMTVKVENDDIWEMCKNGTFKAFSIGCTTHVVKLEEDDE